ncbi:hypothetical protein [Sphingomonas sp. ERG5]|uniref:hypothetical protein n=1 Tax=Sphingomonas sp. ERG5 TaxID=1381597 RepID=UPI00054B2B57|nr:hypothetical protein [Sphingomonas sp. ERG5]
MQIARVEDSFPLNGQIVLNGIVVMEGSPSRSLVREQLGAIVLLRTPEGQEFRAELLKVDVHEAFGGQMQVMIGISPLSIAGEIPPGTVVHSLN